jgi:SulP family sulfate permease
MTGGKRVVGVLAALLVGVPTIFDTELVAYFPKVILGAVVVYLGLGLLVEWIYAAWFKFPKVDFLIIVSVMAVIASTGFLNGLLFGLLVATILFVVSYSRISIVKFALSATDYRSRVTRGAQQQQLLEREGDHVYIMKLQGFVFFGTANSLLDRVRQQAHKASMAMQYILLDFAQVSGMDSTGLLSFTRMWQWAQEQDMTLVLTGLNAQVREQFVRGGFREPSAGLRVFGDLDHGLQWCEDNIVATASAAGLAPRDLVDQLEAVARDRGGIEKLVSYLHRHDFAPGEYVIRQGDTPDMVYFIESGQVSAQLEAPGKEPVRLEAMAGGRAVGELGFFLGIRRTAAVVVDMPSVIYTLSMDELTVVARRDPESASLFYRILAYLLAERVVHLTRVVGAFDR